jgi:hypothetical protein
MVAYSIDCLCYELICDQQKVHLPIFQSHSKIAVLFLQLLHSYCGLGWLFVLIGFFPLSELALLVVCASQCVSQWHAVQLEFLCHILHQEPHVIVLENLLFVHKNYKVWWSDFCLNDVVYLQCAFTVFGQVVHFLELLQPVVQQSCADSLVPFVVCCDDLVHHLVDVHNHFGADKHNRASMKIAQVFLQLAFQVSSGFVLVLFLDRLPLVYNDHHRSAFCNHTIDNLEIVNFKCVQGVHYVDYHMRLLNVEHGADLGFAEVLFLVLGDSWGVEASGINELNFSIFVQYFCCEGIPGGVWNIRNHKFFFLKQLINKRRLANIGPSNKTNLHRMFHSQILDINASGRRRESLFRAHKMIFIIFIIEFFIFLRIGVETAKIALPVFNADTF